MEYLSYVYEKIFGGNPPTDDTQGAFHTWVSAVAVEAEKPGRKPLWPLGFPTFRPRKVICFGNVLLDRLVQLEDPQLLERFGLELGSKGELDMEKLNQLAAEASERWVPLYLARLFHYLQWLIVRNCTIGPKLWFLVRLILHIISIVKVLQV